jgi:hypothetical protein
MLGRTPQITGNDKEDILTLYDQYISLRKELYDTLFNLDDDNINKITAQSIDTSTLIVGDNIVMGPNAVISWGNVSGRPNTTYIDGNGIYTGEITADQITAGTISADYISTDISQVYRLLSLGSGNRNANAGITFNGIASIDADKDSDNLSISARGFIEFDSTISVGDANFFGDVDFSYADVYGLDFASTSHTHDTRYCRNMDTANPLRFQIYNGELEVYIGSEYQFTLVP